MSATYFTPEGVTLTFVPILKNIRNLNLQTI